MKKDKNIEMIDELIKYYPEATCSLDFEKPFELVVAVMLSAQCTDARVNLVTPKLFEKYKTISDYANANISEVEELIHSCGFYKNKAKNIIACADKIIKEFGGKIPNNMEELIKLPGVGRKSANVIMLEVFNNPNGIAVDTHCKRIANRVGLSKQKDPSKIEQDLLKIFPKEYLKDINHVLVFHGRKICDSRNPKCSICPINKYCKNFK